MNNTQRIVRALELALRDSTTQVPANHTLFRKPDMVDVVDGETLKAAIQAIINLAKEEPEVTNLDNVSYMKSDDLANAVGYL